MVMISNNNNHPNKTINLVFLISKFLKFYGEEYVNQLENYNIWSNIKEEAMHIANGSHNHKLMH